jgi:hypothetical protein
VVEVVGEIGDHPAEDGVAEELEPLVRQLARDLGTPGPVRERLPQQAAVLEAVAQPVLERVQVGDAGQDCFTRSYT